MSAYRDMIREDLAATGNIGLNPDWVEAHMRCEHPTLDALSPAAFRAEVRAAAECVRECDDDFNARLAWTQGCGPKPAARAEGGREAQ